jgi:hypothetical protein
MLKIFLLLLILTVLLISFLSISIYIHSNMKGTKIWKFVDKHIITNEDDYIK